ncbi:MAG: hypothetical protein ACYC5J_17825 [Chloroflexota bacterium]
MAKKTALLLNAQADGQFQPAWGPSFTAVSCHSCHGKNGRQDIRSGVVMDCAPCHGSDPHKRG